MRGVDIVFLSMFAVLIAGCGGSSEDEIRQWMVDERNNTKPKVKPIAEPKQFVPQQYANASLMEPFSSQKLTQALKKDSSQTASNGALVAPELARRKEPLEAFPIDTMTLVGSLIKEGQPVALIRVDTLLYQIKLGNHLGQNYGKVIRITETEVTLREIVQDAVGEWIERVATLELQERAK